jgi:hypothetical protein
MRIIPVKVENGILKVPTDLKIPADTQLSILLTKKDEEDISFLEGNKSFSFLGEEPDIYSDNDILPNRKNEDFNK